MSQFKFIDWEVKDEIAIVRLSRPPVNAVSQEMYREIEGLFGDVVSLGGDVKAVVLTSALKHFCAGNDLGEFATLTPENSDERMAEVRAAFFAIQDASLPVIAAVGGSALGTGLAIAASCDFIVAGESASIGVPEIGVGVMGGARHLARIVPEPWVRWMYLTGNPLPATKLKDLGGVIEVVPDAQLLDAACMHAGEITRHSLAAIRMAKRSLGAIEVMDLQPGYEFEQGLTRELSGHPDAREARLATLERRAPNYAANRDG